MKNGQRKRCCLACSCLRDPQKISAGHDAWYRLALDGGWVAIALCFKRLNDEGVQSKFSELRQNVIFP